MGFATVVCCDAIMALFAKDYTIQGHEAGCETCGTSVGITSLDIARWTQPERFSVNFYYQSSNLTICHVILCHQSVMALSHSTHFFSTQKLARAFKVISKAVLTFLINCGWLCKHLEYSWLGWKFKLYRWSNDVGGGGERDSCKPHMWKMMKPAHLLCRQRFIQMQHQSLCYWLSSYTHVLFLQADTLTHFFPWLIFHVILTRTSPIFLTGSSLSHCVGCSPLSSTVAPSGSWDT